MIPIRPVRIESTDCYPLRSKVLRNGKSFEFCTFPEDEHPSTLHVGAFLDDRLISVASFLQVSIPFGNDSGLSFQLRGMATDPEFQGRGAGRSVIIFAEIELKKHCAELIWFNARESAFKFYETLGYKEVDGRITVNEYGPHKIMWKKLI